MPAFSLHKKFSILYVYTKTPENPEILKRKELKKWTKITNQARDRKIAKIHFRIWGKK